MIHFWWLRDSKYRGENVQIILVPTSRNKHWHKVCTVNNLSKTCSLFFLVNAHVPKAILTRIASYSGKDSKLFMTKYTWEYVKIWSSQLLCSNDSLSQTENPSTVRHTATAIPKTGVSRIRNILLIETPRTSRQYSAEGLKGEPNWAPIIPICMNLSASHSVISDRCHLFQAGYFR